MEGEAPSLNHRHKAGDDRRKRMMTQSAFARKVDVDQATINRIEQGLQNVTIDTLERLCRKLKCSAGDLLDQRLG